MLKFTMLAIAGLASLATTAVAADVAPPPEPSDWVFALAPYGWAIGLDGKLGVFGAPEVEVNVDFFDILKDLNVGLMGIAEARNERFTIASDLIWAKLSVGEHTPLGILADKVDVSTDIVILTGLVGYSLYYSDTANLDVVGGARYWSFDTNLSFDGGLLESRSFNDDADWVDPVVGLKGKANIGTDFYLTGWGLIGGFGASSDFMWDAAAIVGYKFNDTFSMDAGYRGMGVDYSSDGFEIDAVLHGPIIGAVFKF